MLKDILTKTSKVLQGNSPEILTGLGVTGVITTSYLASKASIAASDIIRADEAVEGVSSDWRQRYKERIKQTWSLYIPTVVSGTVTIGCIIGASKFGNRRTAAAVTAYSLTERAFSEYREKIVEEFGKGKEQKVRDEIAQDQVTRYPSTSREVIIVGGGHVLCCELFTNRYFRSDMEALKKAQNEINFKIVNGPYVALDEFYELIGLPYTSNSSKIGWDSDKMLVLQFSTVLAEGDEPCLAFEYNYTKPLK